LRGFFGIGIESGKTPANLGTLWRSAQIMGASFIFTIGARYRHHCTDTTKAPRNIPLYQYDTFAEFFEKGLPKGAQLIGVELDEKAVPCASFRHPHQCVYLLGAEDKGLSNEAMNACHALIQLPGEYSLNVAVAGSIVMYDRNTKAAKIGITDTILAQDYY
jgi:tRNA G18 (ribose-2'-O)-methylase SpoU